MDVVAGPDEAEKSHSGRRWWRWGRRRRRAAGDREGAAHEIVVRVAHEVVGACRERDRPGDRAAVRDRCRLVDAGPGEVEVVRRGLVVHLDCVVARLELRDRGTVAVLEIDGRVCADGPDQRLDGGLGTGSRALGAKRGRQDRDQRDQTGKSE